MLTGFQRIVLLCCIICFMLAGAGWFGFRKGFSSGSASIRAEWDAVKVAELSAHLELLQQIAEQEAAHLEAQEQVAHELAEARATHTAALDAQRAAFEQRLLQSARRGQAYRAQAEAGAASCGDLAGHAARLDRALEEGVGLVEEFQGTLGLCEDRLILLGRQIMNDRRLMAGSGE